MAAEINFKKAIISDFDGAIERTSKSLQGIGFGVLTRIDMHTKFKEKLGKDVPKVVILGACNPSLAYEAYSSNTDVASLLPCNVVIREVGDGRVSVEVAKPSAMMNILGDERLERLASQADGQLREMLGAL